MPTSRSQSGTNPVWRPDAMIASWLKKAPHAVAASYTGWKGADGYNLSQYQATYIFLRS